MLLDVVLPAGVSEGDSLEVSDPGGVVRHVIVPAGVAAGETFQVSCAEELADSAIMETFEAWFERESVDDQIEAFVIRNAQRLQFFDSELVEEGSSGEQSHDWWPVYTEYQTEFEALLQRFLDEAGCSADVFLKAAESASGMAETYVTWFLALSEYDMFIEMMKDEEIKQRRMIER